MEGALAFNVDSHLYKLRYGYYLMIYRTDEGKMYLILYHQTRRAHLSLLDPFTASKSISTRTPFSNLGIRKSL